MFLTEFDEDTWRESMKEEGREEGREEGEIANLVRQVCRKLRKKKDIARIAEELEENEVHIKEICSIADGFAPDYDEDMVIGAVIDKMFGKKKEVSA